MPSSPTVRDVHVNRPLENIAIAFLQEPENFFSSKVFPIVKVKSKSDSYYKWDRGDFNRDSAQAVGAGDKYPIGIKSLSEDTYNCKVYKYSEMIADEEYANADGPLTLEKTTIENCMRKHMIRQDRAFVEKYIDPVDVWTGGTTGVDITPVAADKWDNYATSDPIVQLRKEIRALTRKGLARKNMKLLVGPDVGDALVDHPAFIDRQSNDVVKDLDAEFIARILRIGSVVIGESVYNAAAEGDAVQEEFIMVGNHALLVYAAPAPALNAPTGGYTFVWSELNEGIRVKKVRQDDCDADQFLTRSNFDNKLVAPECGMLFRDVLA